MDFNKEKELEIIAKLICLSKDQAGKPEGILAAKMAAKKMAKIGVTEAEIDLARADGTGILEDAEGWEGLCDQGGKRQWVADLACAIGDTFGCKMYFREWGGGTIHFVGTLGDLETSIYFMDVIFSHIERAARKQCPKPTQWKLRNLFGQEATMEVAYRLHSMKAEMEKEIKESYKGGTELMVVKGDLVRKTFSELGRERGFTSARSSRVNLQNSSIQAAGRAAGKSAPIHRAIKA